MKFTVALALLAPASAFVPSSLPAPMRLRKANTAMQMSVGVFYSSTTGNTETVAGYVTEACGVEAADIADAEDITAFDGLIIGAPTWHTVSSFLRVGGAPRFKLRFALADVSPRGVLRCCGSRASAH